MFLWQGLASQLKLAAEAFLDSDDGLSIDMSKKQIMLTKILSWYQEDFGKNKEEVLFLSSVDMHCSACLLLMCYRLKCTYHLRFNI